MKKKFQGFPPGKVRITAIPAQFFSEVLPAIDDLAELKVTLFCYWALQQKEGEYRYLRWQDLASDEMLKASLQVIASSTETATILENALMKALERGTLLAIAVESESTPGQLYFANTVNGRQAIEQIKLGNWKPGSDDQSIEILPERPNVYGLYEQNIGPLTPIIADEIKDASKEYPEFWIREAIHQAVENNARHWNYIRTILERWKREGKTREITGRDRVKNDKRHISRKYADFIES